MVKGLPFGEGEAFLTLGNVLSPADRDGSDRFPESLLLCPLLLAGSSSHSKQIRSVRICLRSVSAGGISVTKFKLLTATARTRFIPSGFWRTASGIHGPQPPSSMFQILTRLYCD